MKPTPETDDRAYGGDWESVVSADFARKLEIQRDEADAYIMSIWQDHQLPSMPPGLQERLIKKVCPA